MARRVNRLATIPSGEIPIHMKFRANRHAQGFTLERIAEITGYSGSTISHFEQGRDSASEKALDCWAQAMGLTLVDIVETSREFVAEWLNNPTQLLRIETVSEQFAPIAEQIQAVQRDVLDLRRAIQLLQKRVDTLTVQLSQFTAGQIPASVRFQLHEQPAPRD